MELAIRAVIAETNYVGVRGRKALPTHNINTGSRTNCKNKIKLLGHVVTVVGRKHALIV